MYTQIYLTSVEKLVKAPIWERQRILRPERAMAIAEDRMKKAQQQVFYYSTGITTTRMIQLMLPLLNDTIATATTAATATTTVNVCTAATATATGTALVFTAAISVVALLRLPVVRCDTLRSTAICCYYCICSVFS
jgi:hypothetical protein